VGKLYTGEAGPSDLAKLCPHRTLRESLSLVSAKKLSFFPKRSSSAVANLKFNETSAFDTEVHYWSKISRQ
jgi:hypothetical protein